MIQTGTIIFSQIFSQNITLLWSYGFMNMCIRLCECVTSDVDGLNNCYSIITLLTETWF